MPLTSNFDQLFTGAVLALAGFYLLRCVLGALLYWLGRLPGGIGRGARSLSRRITPTLARRAAATLVGALVVGSAGAGAAHAETLDLGTPATSAATSHEHRQQPAAGNVNGLEHQAVSIPGLDRGELPAHRGQARDKQPAHSHAKARSEASIVIERAGSDTHIVVEDDCLWDLAAAQLASSTALGDRGATSTDIDRQWRRWYAANRETIGADPAVLRVGTRLRIPTTINVRQHLATAIGATR